MSALVAYEHARKAVAEYRADIAAAKTVDEIKRVRIEAAALRAMAIQAKNRELEIDAAEIRFLSERRLGEMLRAAKECSQIAASRPKKHSDTDLLSRFTLQEAGIDPKLSMRAQRLAAVPAERFSALIADWRERLKSETERVSLTLLRESEAELKRAPYEARVSEGATIDDLQALAKSGAKFGVIYADPPWAFETYSAKGKERSAEKHYDTESAAAIRALPVAQLAAKDCVLLLWATMPMLPQALALIEAWGFAYKTCGFVWIKTNRPNANRPAGDVGSVFFKGQGFWTRANAELCLLAAKGAPKRLDKDVAQLVVAAIAEHSQKPLETRGRIERLVCGPYLELYGRDTAPGWTVWGNEIRRADFARAVPAKPARARRAAKSKPKSKNRRRATQ